MARNDDDETRWTRQLLIGLAALVAVALVIGGVVSVLALGAAKVTGIDEAKPSTSAKPSLVMPSGEPTTKVDGFPDPTGDPSPTPTESATPSAKPSAKPRGISLQVLPRKVSPNQRINLTGVYEKGEGATLQVQRFEGGAWVDFPVTASVTGGNFTTYITTGRTGVNRLRVVDLDSDKRSNAVRVTVG
jgi:hypothetical protein